MWGYEDTGWVGLLSVQARWPNVLLLTWRHSMKFGAAVSLLWEHWYTVPNVFKRYLKSRLLWGFNPHLLNVSPDNILSSTFFHRENDITVSGHGPSDSRTASSLLPSDLWMDLPCIKLIFLDTLAMTVTLHSALSRFLLYERYALSLQRTRKILFHCILILVTRINQIKLNKTMMRSPTCHSLRHKPITAALILQQRVFRVESASCWNNRPIPIGFSSTFKQTSK